MMESVKYGDAGQYDMIPDRPRNYAGQTQIGLLNPLVEKTKSGDDVTLEGIAEAVGLHFAATTSQK